MKNLPTFAVVLSLLFWSSTTAQPARSFETPRKVVKGAPLSVETPHQYPTRAPKGISLPQNPKDRFLQSAGGATRTPDLRDSRNHSSQGDSAQPAWIQYFASDRAPSVDWAADIATDRTGNVYVTGYGPSPSNGADFVTVKYGPDGAQHWVARYNGPAGINDYATALAVDGAGNVYVTGASYNGDGGIFSDFATIKYNTSGEEQWVVGYDGGGAWEDWPIDLEVDGVGNVYVMGISPTGYENDDIVTIKYNASGGRLWVDRYDGNVAQDSPADLSVDSLGSVYVTGSSLAGPTFETTEIATIKYSPSGVRRWVALFGGPGIYQSYAAAIGVDGAGNVYVTGTSSTDSAGATADFVTVKYNSSGGEEWIARYSGPGRSSNRPTALSVDGLGNAYVTGISSASMGGYATVKYNPLGEEEWVGVGTGLSDHVIAAKIAVDGSGHVYVSGSGSQGGSRTFEYATIKYSSSGVQQWSKFSNFGGGSWQTGMALDDSGNVLITGSSANRAQSGNDDFVRVKYSTKGAELWSARYDGPGTNGDVVFDMDVDRLGNVYVTGLSGTYFDSGDLLGGDIVTMKYASDGELSWRSRCTPPFDRYRHGGKISVDSMGNVFAASGIGGNGIIVKHSSSGVQQWVAHQSGIQDRWGSVSGLEADASGNVYLAGYTYDPQGASYFVTIKYDHSGTEEWLARIANGDAQGLAIDDSGNAYVTGSIGDATNSTRSDYLTVKYDPAGVECWRATYDGPANSDDWGVALGLDKSGNVYVTGNSKETTDEGYVSDIATLKYGPSGAQEWVARYGSPGIIDWVKGIAVSDLGNVYVAGLDGTGVFEDEGALLKYNSSGSELWVTRLGVPSSPELVMDGSENLFTVEYLMIHKYDSSGVERWHADLDGYVDIMGNPIYIGSDSPGNVYISGTYESQTSPIMVTMKYSQSTTVQAEEDLDVPVSSSLSQNFPNPFNPTTIIRYQLPQTGDVRMVVCDLLGQEVAMLVNEKKVPGSYEVKFNASGLASGVYLYRLQAGDFVQTKKLVLVR